MSHAAHLEAVYSARFKLGETIGHLVNTIAACEAFDAALTLAVGDIPGTDPGQRGRESAILLRDALKDAARLTDHIDDLLTEYRKGI